MKAACLLISMTIILLTAATGWPDCRGCCSGHGGTVCRGGMTVCADGTMLSKRCRAKGCNECAGYSDGQRSSRPAPTYIDKPLPKEPPESSNPNYQDSYGETSSFRRCVCSGVVTFTDGQCPCDQYKGD